ncbi:FtsW/RodA/SpoVE family cell cycle protein [Aerococcus urinae]|uniref:FtsW/RodA/SpoVE family cell cycle protein n=1 Tax=Aerococcus urinae TaxID=1376 RepID=UPI00227C8486|nr:FtsW/RodA/SpoVE family cell cycle protein [Aerococcus urinae]MCY3048032.1 rod shape-determining protein RodA [Aerococcus urinae]
MARSRSQRLKKVSQAKSINPTIIALLLALMAMSVAVIFSTTYLQFGGGALKPTLMQIFWYVVSFIAIAFVMQIDKKTFYRFVPVLYGFGIFLLILVLFFYDRQQYTSFGAKSWFTIGTLSFQPSEIMKFFYILMMSRLVSEYNQRTEALNYDALPVSKQLKWDFKFIGRMILWTAVPVVLILLQNDFGTTLVFMMIFSGMIFASGVNWRIILTIALIIGTIFAGLLFLVIYNRDLLYHLGFQDYQFARIDSWLAPFENTRRESYQLSQSIKAIGSGQWLGKGFGNFEVYVPVRESDMIFSTIGENFGFIGSSLLILLYFLLILTMIAIAYESYDSFYIAGTAGIVSMILFHIVENIGMSIGLLPLTGIPLPFISQGGSALLTNMLCMGFVLSIQYNENRSEAEIKQHWLNRLLRKLSGGDRFDQFIWP